MDEERYSMNHRRGKALIFNMQATQAGPREFSDIDAANLYQILSSLNFKVDLVNSQTQQQLDNKLRKVAEEDHSEIDAFVCIVLSHGDYGVIEAKDKPVQVDTFMEYFKGHNCRSLAGKPKIFIFQACNPLLYKPKSEVADTIEADFSTQKSYKIPSEADFLIVWSLVPGFIQRPSGKKGSMFVEHLCKRLDKHRDKEVNYILTRVLRDVCSELESNDKLSYMFESSGKQLPCVINMLTKELYFPKKS